MAELAWGHTSAAVPPDMEERSARKVKRHILEGGCCCRCCCCVMGQISLLSRVNTEKLANSLGTDNLNF